jgi:uncharacterized protein (DUF302 family)
MAVGRRGARIGDEMLASHPRPDDLVELIAERFRALSELSGSSCSITCASERQRARADGANRHNAEPRLAKAAKAHRPLPGGGVHMLTTGRYTLTAATEARFEEAVDRVRAELKDAGFGVLCEIDVQAVLREKLGLEREPYLILGACNPTLAHQALEAERELGALLPCNVVVYEHSGETRIAAIDPERMLSIVDNEGLDAIAARVKALLAGVVERAVEGAGPHPHERMAENEEGYE